MDQAYSFNDGRSAEKKQSAVHQAANMGNFISAGTSLLYTGDTKQEEQGYTLKTEDSAFNIPANTKAGPLDEKTTETLMHMASSSLDLKNPDNALMLYVTQNQNLLKRRLYTILGQLHSKVSSSSEEPLQQKWALNCLIVLGAIFPKKTFNFLVKKMDEVWKDTVLVFHTIDILKAVFQSNELPASRDYQRQGLKALDYRQGLLTKLLIIAGVWHTSKIRIAALELLCLVDSMIHENIHDQWRQCIAPLLRYLKRGPENLKQQDWENRLLLFLEDTIIQISSEHWVTYFVQSLTLHLSCCSPLEKNFIYKCWGVAMMASLGTLLEASLWGILQEMNFEETKEREGFAYGLGLCAMCHMEEVISILEEYQNYVIQLTTQCYYMEGSEVPITKEQMRIVLLLSYYYVAFLAPTEVILPIMPGIFTGIIQNYHHCLKDPVVKSAFIDSVILMCQAAMEEDVECSLQSRRMMMIYLKDILLETPESCLEIENCQKATKAIICLVNMNMQKPSSAQETLSNFSMIENTQQAEKPTTEQAAAGGSKNSMLLSCRTPSPALSQISEVNYAAYSRNLLAVPSDCFSSSFYPILPNDNNLEVIDLCISSIMKFPPWDLLENTELFANSFIPQASWDSLEMREDIADTSELETQICYRKTFEAVYEIIRTLIEWHMEPETLDNILKALKHWLLSQQTHERERATRAIAQVLQIYRNQTPPKMQQSILNVGHLTGQLLPCCVEKQPALHHWGIAAISSLLNALGQPKTEITPKESIRILEYEKKNVSNANIFQVAMLVVNFLPSDELMQFIRSTLEGMLLNERYTEAIADVLKIVIHHRHDELQDRVEILVHIMYDILHNSDTMIVKRAMRSTIGVLAYVEPDRMVTTLLNFPWVILGEIRTLWRSLIANKTLFSIVLPVLLNKIPKQNEKNKEKNETPEKPTYLPNSMTDVLWEFIAAVKKKEQLEAKKEALFYHCFLSIPGTSTKQLIDNISEEYRVSSFLSAPNFSVQSCTDTNEDFKSSSFSSLPETSMKQSKEIIKGCRIVSPCSAAVQALQKIMKLGGCENHILLAMDEYHGWELMVDNQEQHRGFAALGRFMGNCCPGAFPRTVVQDFLPCLYFHKELCWTACVAFFAEFVGSPNIAKEEQKMIQDVFNVMKLFIYHGNPIIIMYGMRGVSNAIHTMTKKEKKYKETILGIFLRSLSSPWDPYVKQEAITGISKILENLPSIQSSTSIQLAQEAQNCFDDDNPLVRHKALEIFGQQTQYFRGKKETFGELVEKYLAHILIHLQDDDPEVAKAAEVTLWKCAPFIRYKPLRSLILNFLHKEGHKVTKTFLMEVSRLLVEDSPGRLQRTLSSRTAAACDLIGHLMKQEENKTEKVFPTVSSSDYLTHRQGQCLPAILNLNNINRN